MPDEKLTPQEIQATRIFESGKENTLDRGKAIPIIMVPGVMGSRLSFPAHNDAWDPDSKMNMIGWAGATPERAAAILDARGSSIGQVMSDAIKYDARLVDIWHAVDPARDKAFYGKQRGWGGASHDFYGELLASLEARFNAAPYVPGQHPVYAFGYDWRKGNANSGALLAKRIQHVTQKHGAKQAILVTHSMGGLVARAACKGSGAASMVKGVVHVVQPINGAVTAYRRFAEGMSLDRSGIEGRVMAGILGGTWWGYAMIMSGTDGPLQLLPNQLYGDWLTLPSGARAQAAQIYAFYKSGSAESVVPSISKNTIFEMDMNGMGAKRIELGDFLKTGNELERERTRRILDKWEVYRGKLMVGLTKAESFHAVVGGYAHPKTFILYAGDLRSEVAYNWTLKTRHVQDGRGGDGTVPNASARALDEQVKGAWGGNAPPKLALSENVGGFEHSAVFAGAGVMDRIYKRIEALRLLPDA